MKSSVKFVLTGIAATIAVTNLNAQITLDTGDTDIGIGYEDAWDLHVHKEEAPNAGEYEPDEVFLQINANALTTVPAGSQWSFLGNAGDPVWVLPQIENPNLLFLGLATEEIADGIFLNNEVTLSLRGVSGPGYFSVYTVSLGTPTVLMNSEDGISAGGSIVLPTGTHQHFNYGFTAPGSYTVSFEASGTLVAGSQFTQSGSVDYSFVVVPEPSTAALTGVGMGALLLAMRRRNQTRH